MYSWSNPCIDVALWTSIWRIYEGKMGARHMIKNLKDIIVVVLVIGVLTLLRVIIIGDYYVALQENRPVDESVITLMKMSLTGMIGIIAGYIGGK